MALLWERASGGVHYQVRSAGRTLRLYTDGVLHTQYNPARLLTGSVWDLLLLPALLVPPARLRRVLVLGVGGGAVIRQLLELFPGVQVVGVELNAVHLAVARRWFGLRDARVELVHADAVAWLAGYAGEPFDLVIEDLFGERDGEPCRAVAADATWFASLLQPLAPHGVLAMNFAGAAEVRASAWGRAVRGDAQERQLRWLRRRLPAALSLATPTCENRVVTFLPQPATVAGLRAAVAAEPALCSPLLRWDARALH